jgi:hypothetical protein
LLVVLLAPTCIGLDRRNEGLPTTIPALSLDQSIEADDGPVQVFFCIFVHLVKLIFRSSNPDPRSRRAGASQ